MILFLLLFYLVRTETVDIYSIYSSKYEQLCTNFHLQAKGLKYDNGSAIESIRFSTPGVHELKTNDSYSYLFNLIDCNNFNWGMSSSNENRFVLSENDTLRIWVDDASSFKQASDNLPNEVSKQLTSMIYSMGVHPVVTISDAVTREIYQTINDFDFDTENMWWEASIDCSVNFFYDIHFQDLVGFSSPTGQQPFSNTNVYPPIPKLIHTKPTNGSDGKRSLLGVTQCPCIPPLNAFVNKSQIYISSTNFINYSIIDNINKAKLVDFIDNSLIYIDDDAGLIIQNFADTGQQFTLNPNNYTNISSPNFCSFSSTLKRDQPSAVIAWNHNNPTGYGFINLTEIILPNSTYHELENGEEIVYVTSTLSSKNDFYLIINNTNTNEYFLRKINVHNKEIEKVDLNINSSYSPSLFWSPFGYIFLIYGNIVQCSSESQILFSDLQFSNESERDNVVFKKVLENEKGEFIITTEDGEIFFMTIDAPILSKIQTRFNPSTDEIVVNTEGNIFIIVTNEGDYFPIPLESEMNILKMKSQFWNHTICPNSVEIDENFPDGHLLVDKNDTLTFSGSIFSRNPQKFVIHTPDNFIINTTSYYEEVIQLQPQTNRFLPLKKQNFNLTLIPKETGIGRFVVHTTSPSWICGNEMITRNFVIGCPSTKEFRIRGGSKINHFYTDSYIRPIVDIYDLGQFVEEYKGNLTVFSDEKIGFAIEDCNVLNGTNNNKIILYKFNKEYKLTLIGDQTWSYCNLSAVAYVTISTPSLEYYLYSVSGFAFYCLLMIIYGIVVFVQWRKKNKE